MSWDLVGFWIVGLALIGIVSYLELGFTVERQDARARAMAAHPSNHDPMFDVADVGVVRVRCSECGEVYAIEPDVLTGDGHHNVGYREILEALFTHRRIRHGAAA